MAVIFAIKEEYEKSMANLEYAIELDENFLNEAIKDTYFTNIKNQIYEFCEAREKLNKKNKQKKNFMSDKFSLFKKKEELKISSVK